MYRVDIVVEGYPGKSVCHGGLGWSTIAMVRVEKRVALIDVGGYSMRKAIMKHLKANDLTPNDVTDVVLTHSHHDHSVNWILFPKARVWIAEQELNWATRQPPGFNPIPELYVRELARSPQLNFVQAGKEILPGLTALPAPGHTPGHLMYLMEDKEKATIFTGDSAKNRVELLTQDADASMDHAATVETIRKIVALWRSKKGSVLVPGHDLSMVLDDSGKPVYITERKAGIAAWFNETLHDMSVIDLTEKAARR